MTGELVTSLRKLTNFFFSIIHYLVPRFTKKDIACQGNNRYCNPPDEEGELGASFVHTEDAEEKKYG